MFMRFPAPTRKGMEKKSQLLKILHFIIFKNMFLKDIELYHLSCIFIPPVPSRYPFLSASPLKWMASFPLTRHGVEIETT